MSTIPVAVAAQVDRLRVDGRSTHWPRGTPNTGPGPVGSLDLSESFKVSKLGYIKVKITKLSYPC